MTQHPDPIGEVDIHAYLDEQLLPQRRIEVEAYLSQTPEMAARVMADLRVRDELRLAMRTMEPIGRGRTRNSARVLEQALRNRGRIVLLRRAAVIAAFVSLGWVAHSVVNPFAVTPVVASVPTPTFVREAMLAHATTLVREKVHPGATPFAMDDVREATGIALPAFPPNWTLLDSQIFPSSFGSSVEIAVKPRNGEEMTLYAAKTGTFAVQRVTLAHSGKAVAAYWQIGEAAYALVSEGGNSDELTEAAGRLAKTLY
ncbi:anti-sigma factor [Rhizobium sp.]|jgi:anti-sigma factor RsiW|uniref:anti-sigma factor family protein n=1 Tax=Rhizobium sp. TaxID=391 RepID=UPI000E8C5C5F|nr:Fis family transcriptional regulator [Rhizobium sp.]